MTRALLALPLLLVGCAPAAWQAGFTTAGTIVDTAAVVRARQLGLCGATPPQILTAEDAFRIQAEIEALKRDLADAQGELTRLAIERARTPLPTPTATTAPPAP